MSVSGPTKIAFWIAICFSCVLFAFAALMGAAAVGRYLEHGHVLAGKGSIENLIVLAIFLQPVVVMLLIIRAIRLRDDGTPLRIIARPLYSLVLVPFWIADQSALQYLDFKAEMRRQEIWTIGSIAYDCSKNSRTVDYNPKKIGPIELKLTEFRHQGRLSTWIVRWPGKPPINAVSFDAHTGSIGGSEGIKWRESDGRSMIAYLSFSDIVGEYGPLGVWIDLVQSNVALKEWPPDKAPSPSAHFTCGPAPGSYRP